MGSNGGCGINAEKMSYLSDRLSVIAFFISLGAVCFAIPAGAGLLPRRETEEEQLTGFTWAAQLQSSSQSRALLDAYRTDRADGGTGPPDGAGPPTNDGGPPQGCEVSRSSPSREHVSRSSNRTESGGGGGSSRSGCSGRSGSRRKRRRLTFSFGVTAATTARSAIRNVVMFEGMENNRTPHHFEYNYIRANMRPPFSFERATERFVVLRILDYFIDFLVESAKNAFIFLNRFNIAQKGLGESTEVHQISKGLEKFPCLLSALTGLEPPFLARSLAFTDCADEFFGRLSIRINDALAFEQEFVFLFRDSYGFRHINNNLSFELIKPCGGAG